MVAHTMSWAFTSIFCVSKSSKSPPSDPSFSSTKFSLSAAVIPSNSKQVLQSPPPLFSSNSIQEHRKNISFKTQCPILSRKAASFDKKIEDLDTAVQLLEQDGDWSKEKFWDFIKFLRNIHKTNLVLQVFDVWKKRENSRINEDNYEKIIRIVLEEGHIEEAASALSQMKTYGLRISVDTYEAVIQEFSRKGKFEDALLHLKEMKANGLRPSTQTYDRLIQAYGKYGMYDEIGTCLKDMKSIGSLPDHTTYNLLIREFAKAGLLKKMESTCQTLLSNKMELQSSTLISMLEAYAKFRICDKMEKCAIRVLKSKTRVNEDLIRKVAAVYIVKLMFSRLEELGHGLSLRSGSTDLVWCLRMLSHACTCSRKGMHSILHEMESNKVAWNVTIANILSLSYLKMKDFTHLNVLLSELPFRLVKPDIVTIGILSDACNFGFDSSRVKNTWRRSGYFQEKVDMLTDPLVLTAFGKGQFLTDFEGIYYSSIDFKSKNRDWNYGYLIQVMDGYTQCHKKNIHIGNKSKQ